MATREESNALMQEMAKQVIWMERVIDSTESDLGKMKRLSYTLHPEWRR